MGGGGTLGSSRHVIQSSALPSGLSRAEEDDDEDAAECLPKH